MKFDESEGILAMASVSAFFITLLGQIRDKLAIRPSEEAVRQSGRAAGRHWGRGARAAEP